MIRQCGLLLSALLVSASVEAINGPTYTEDPGDDGADVIRVNVSRFYDADRFLVELNQPIDEIKPGS
jgi:hypothetical protein